VGADRPRVYVSGKWEIDCTRRELRLGGAAVPIGSRAFEIIEVLVQSPGELVTKDDLMSRVWPGAIVEENTLQVHIYAIRKALGADRSMLKTASGRGYRLTGSWQIREEKAGARPDARWRPRTAAHPFQTNVPVAASALIGRETAVRQLRDLLSAYRVVTLTGPGGIGKTVLAAEVARRIFPTLENDVLLVELASLSDPHLVPSAVASMLGLQLGGVISAESVARAIGDKRILFVLDNCEHVINEAAKIAETIIRACPHTSILATSREVLRIDGECVYDVPRLDVPSQRRQKAAELVEHSAVQLFVARTRALRADFLAQEENLPMIAAICRRLDGIPLALEFAAARAASLGVQQVVERLDDRFGLLTSGRRTALPRHQTLRATLDWSYELLPEAEQCLLRHLAIFPAGFTLEAAAAVISDGGDCAPIVMEWISNLVAKSLVNAELETSMARYRLLETTRAYAMEKLGDNGERQESARRHAEYYRALFEHAGEDAAVSNDWLADYAREIDNLRLALDWAFAEGGNASTGVALAVAAMPIWFAMSLLDECLGWVEKALRVLGPLDRPTNEEMALQYALGYSLMYQQGANDRAQSALRKVVDLAVYLGDLDYQLRALVRLAGICSRSQDYHGALAIGLKAEKACKTSSDPVMLSAAHGIVGPSLQFLGEYGKALTYAQRTYANTAATAVRQIHIARFGRDSFVSAGLDVARVHWAQGRPDQAAQMAHNVLTDAEAAGHPVSLCPALTWCGCLIPLWRGELSLAEAAITRLKEHAQIHGFSAYYATGISFEGVLAAGRGELVAAERLLRAGLQHLQQKHSQAFYTIFLTGLAGVLLASGQLAEALAVADEAVQRTEQPKAPWWMPEALRVKGEVLQLREDSAELAVDNLRRSLGLAHQQGALSWELRAATSLASLLRNHQRLADAVACLQPVYDRFTEGFSTADLIAAKQLLDDTRPNVP
jgi:non-specific serine/threonine protein kinase